MRAIIWTMMLAGIAVRAQVPAEAPKRTVFDSKQNLKKPEDAPAPKPVSAPVRPDSQRNAGSSALDALTTSSENLNSIRDSNVRKLSGDGCAPEVSARIVDLRSRLGIRNTATKKDAGSETAALALASGWFKSSENANPLPSQQKKTDVLDSVLPGSEKDAKPAQVQTQDAAALQSELDRLLASCSGAKR